MRNPAISPAAEPSTFIDGGIQDTVALPVAGGGDVVGGGLVFPFGDLRAIAVAIASLEADVRAVSPPPHPASIKTAKPTPMMPAIGDAVTRGRSIFSTMFPLPMNTLDFAIQRLHQFLRPAPEPDMALSG